jgi:hypothetical protein
MAGKKNARAAAEDRLLGWFQEFVSDPGETGIIAFCEHIEMQLTTDDMGRSWWPRFLAHYAGADGVDEYRFANDLATFPPIVRRVAKIKAERAGRR